MLIRETKSTVAGRKGDDVHEPKTVIEKVAEKCRFAHLGGMPLILLDTDELQLVEELALRGDLVDLLTATGKKPVGQGRRELEELGSASASVWQPYYRFLHTTPGGLSSCSNYITDPRALTKLCALNGNMDTDNRSGKPCLFVLHLTQDSWTPKKTENSMVGYLRTYVDAFLRCEDPNAPLRTSVVLLYGDVSLLPRDLKGFTDIVDVPYPDMKEIYSLVESISQEYGTAFELADDKWAITKALAGFSVNQIRRIMARLILNVDENARPLLFVEKAREKIILDTKKQVLLQNGGLLELQKRPFASDRPNELAGMQNYRKWVEKNRARARDPEELLRSCGIKRLKGVLLCGVPGCGKSEAAKILSQEWDLPTVKMSVDRLMGGYVGDSERNMRDALKQAEAMSPCILWIDELDKGFSGTASGNGSDSAVFKRMFGHFLTWMQENERPCFIFATANDIGQLPPELFRSGRFDELYSVYMPTSAECIEIFREHMRRTAERRAKANKALSVREELEPLFDDDCYSDKTMEKVINLFLDTKILEKSPQIKFVNGGDIEKIVSYAMMKIQAKKTQETNAASKKIASWEWLEAMREVIGDPNVSTYGCSGANLDGIAACYARLIRGAFSPAGDLLLDKSVYHSGWDDQQNKIVCTYKPTSDYLAHLSPYDRALHDAIASRFERIATQIENNTLQRLCL